MLIGPQSVYIYHIPVSNVWSTIVKQSECVLVMEDSLKTQLPVCVSHLEPTSSLQLTTSSRTNRSAPELSMLHGSLTIYAKISKIGDSFRTKFCSMNWVPYHCRPTSPRKRS